MSNLTVRKINPSTLTTPKPGFVKLFFDSIAQRFKFVDDNGSINNIGSQSSTTWMSGTVLPTNANDDEFYFKKDEGKLFKRVAGSWQLEYDYTITSLTDVLLTADIPMPSAILLTSGTVPITAVVAPGSGKIIQAVTVMVDYEYGTAQYEAPPIGIYYDGFDNPISVISIHQDTQSGYLITTPSGFISPIGFENRGLIIRTMDGTDPLAGDGNMKFRITYKIINN